MNGQEIPRRAPPRLPKPTTLGPRLGFQLGEVIKRLIGRAVEVSDGPFVSLPITGKRSKRWGIDQRALWQLALLEAVLSVPGHVEGLLVLIKSTILFTSPERCTAALKDAADANRRLATWVELLQPGVLGRLILFAVELASFVIYVLGFVLCPAASRSLAAYLEYTGSRAYALALQDVDAEGPLASFGSQLIPWTTCVLCDLQVGSTVHDALPIFSVETEEHSAAFLTAAHSEAPWWHRTAPAREVYLHHKHAVTGAASPSHQSSPAQQSPAKLRVPSNRSINRVSQLFDSKWAPSPEATPGNTVSTRAQQHSGPASAVRGTTAQQSSTGQQNGEADVAKLSPGLAAEEVSGLLNSPRGGDLAPTTPPGETEAPPGPQLSEGELEAPGQATPPAAEVFVDAKETLTPLDFGVGDDKASGSWLDSPVPIPHAPQS